MTTDELIDRLIRVKDSLTHRADRDAISEACNRLASADRSLRGVSLTADGDAKWAATGAATAAWGDHQ